MRFAPAVPGACSVRYGDAVTSIDEASDTVVASTVTVPPATATEDGGMALFGTLVIIGGAPDGWAHNKLLAQIQREGFITPWHGIAYTGFFLSAVWVVLIGY